MINISRTLKFACLSAALVLGACTPKQEAVNTAPPPAPPPPAAPAPAPVTSQILPGSAEDFRVNVGDTVHFAYRLRTRLKIPTSPCWAARRSGSPDIRRCG